MSNKWDFIRKHESSFNRKCARALKKHIDEHPIDYPLTKKEMFNLFGLKYNHEIIRNNDKIDQLLVKHRNHVDDLLEECINNGAFDKYKNNGHSETEIYHLFIQKCLSEYIVPLYADVNNKYYLINIDSFIDKLNSRLKADSNEIKNKFSKLKIHHKLIPKKIKQNLEYLSKNEDIGLIKARDELNRFLPEHNDEEDS